MRPAKELEKPDEIEKSIKHVANFFDNKAQFESRTHQRDDRATSKNTWTSDVFVALMPLSSLEVG